MAEHSKDHFEQKTLSLCASVLYISLVAVLCVIPSIGLLLGGAETSSDSDAVPAPSLTTADGSVNVNIMADAGDWFNAHFAFRNEWVTAASWVESLWGVSPKESVVLGTDGWLYYGDTVDDYRGINQLSDRALYDIAHSMKLVQTYALAHGANFAFVLSPNKNTLYGEHMPYYYQILGGDTNLDRIIPFLESEKVNYVDARTVIQSKDEVLYHQRDSHWNNKGASMVADALMKSLSQKHRDYTNEPFTVQRDFIGDLDKMLFPAAPTPEDEIYYENAPAFEYVTPNIESNFDPRIQTKSAVDDAEGSLVMYRDSFCNSLLPFMAEGFAEAYFSRGIPYQIAIDLEQYAADTLVIERAQRFMRDLAATAPAMPAPMLLDDAIKDALFFPIEGVETENQGEYIIAKGQISEESIGSNSLSQGDRIAVRLNGNLIYEAFGICDATTAQEGFQVMIPSSVTTGNDEFELAIW